MKLLVLLLLLSSVAYGQSTYYIRADTVRFQKVGGNTTFFLENASKSKTGAYLRNYSNGRTDFYYAVDSASVSGSNLILWRGGGTQNITVGIPASAAAWNLTGNASTVPGTNFLGTVDENSLMFKVGNSISGFVGNRVTGALSDSVFIGHVTLGRGALKTVLAAATNGGGIVAIGPSCLRDYESGGAGELVSIGVGAMLLNKTGHRNTAVGNYSMFYEWSGQYNAYFAQMSGEMSSGGEFNTGIGAEALRSTKMGDHQTAVGWRAGYLQTTGIFSVTITAPGKWNSAPTVTFSAPEATGSPVPVFQATGTAIWAADSTVTGVTMTSYGTGYSTQKASVTVTFSGGGQITPTTGTVNLWSANRNTSIGVSAAHDSYFSEDCVSVGYFAGATGSYDFKMTHIGANSKRGGAITQIWNGTSIGYGSIVSQSNSIVLGIIDSSTNVGIGTATPSYKSMLDIASTTRGVLLPRMNGTQQAAITSPVTGLLIYNTDSLAFVYYNGTAWTKVGSGGSGSTSPAGSNTQVQFNSSGSFGASNDFTFVDATNVLSVGETNNDGEVRSYQIPGFYVALKTNGTSNKSGLFRSNTDFFAYYSTATGATHIDATLASQPINFDIMGTTKMNLNSSGRLFIGGTTSATANLHVAASTSAASTGQIKLAEGTRQTTPEDGTINYIANNIEFVETSTVYILAKTLIGTGTLDFGSTVAGTSTDLTITVTGAADGDPVILGTPNSSTSSNGVFSAWVSAANTVTVRFSNNSLTLAIDPASGSFKVSVNKQ